MGRRIPVTREFNKQNVIGYLELMDDVIITSDMSFQMAYTLYEKPSAFPDRVRLHELSLVVEPDAPRKKGETMTDRQEQRPIGKITQEIRFTLTLGKAIQKVPEFIAIELGGSGGITFASVHSAQQVSADTFEVTAYLIRNTKENYPRNLGGYPVYAVRHVDICNAFNVPAFTPINDIIFWEPEFQNKTP